MRGVASVLIAGGLGCAGWAGLTHHVPFAAAETAAVGPFAVHGPTAMSAAVIDSDADRRARLNARLRTMIKEGKGVRLTDAPPHRQDAPLRAVSAKREAAPAGSTSLETPRSTPSRNRGGYMPPTLDLKTPPRPPGDELACLTQAVYYEARNESEAGQTAVAEVVLNRSRHRAYPKGVCDVVYQRNSRTCQFTFTCDGSIGRRPVDAVAWARAERIAREVYEGRSISQLPKNSVNYHADYVRPSWGQRLARVRQIGAHIFYGEPLNGGSTPGAHERDTTPAPRLLFVRNEALDRAYALISAAPEQNPAP